MTYLPDKANLQDIREVNTQSAAHEDAKYYYNEPIVVLPGKRFMSKIMAITLTCWQDSCILHVISSCFGKDFLDPRTELV